MYITCVIFKFCLQLLTITCSTCLWSQSTSYEKSPDDSMSDVETSECYVSILSLKTLFPAIITFHFIICRTLTLMAHALYRVVWIIH